MQSGMISKPMVLSHEINYAIMDSSSSSRISIAIVEDLVAVAQELRDVINEEPDMLCTQVYHNAEEAITFLVKQPPQLVLIDIGLPGISGIEAIVQLKQMIPKTEFCMFTVFEDDDKIFKSITAGAKGYILKNSAPELIIHSLRDLSKGGSPMNPVIARKVIDSFSNKGTTQVRNQDLPLTKREEELLDLLSTGMLYKEISHKLGITVGTVKQHIHKIYHKLQVNNKTEAINLYLNRN